MMNIEEITVPFPPTIKPEDILEKRRQNRKSAKCPNAFFIYRIAFLDQLRIHKCRVKMTDMSGYVSIAWKKEPLHVKTAYKELARKVERLVIDARQKALAYQQQQQIKQLPVPTYPEPYQYINNINNANFINNNHYNQYFDVPINFYQPFVPSQNLYPMNLEPNDHFLNNNQFSPILSDVNTPIFDEAQLPLMHLDSIQQQQPFINENLSNLPDISYFNNSQK